MKRIIHWGWCTLEILIILYVIFVTSLILCQNKYGYTELFGYTFKNVQKSDLRYIKNVRDGDLVVIKNSHEIQQNDIVYYYFVSNEAYTIANDTVMKVDKNNNDTSYTIHTSTKNLVVDDSRIIGKKASAYPFFGGLLEKIASKTGFLLFVLLPIMIVFIYQVYEFFFTVRKQVEGKNNIIDSSPVNTGDNNLDTNDSFRVEEKNDKKNDSEVIKEEKIETSEESENKSDVVVEDRLEEEKFRFVAEDKSDDEIEIL